jgi:multicomponent Na+:H+ antiporter subunit E
MLAQLRDPMNTRITHSCLGSVLSRGLLYFAFWVLLIGFKPVDLAVGLVAASAATWASIVLLPPGEFRLRLAGLARYSLHFAWQSVIAGVDVARRVFAPDMRLRPGLVGFASAYPRGPGRNAFASLTSLLPGSLALRDEPRALIYHSLDTSQPVQEQLAGEELALSRILPPTPAS